MASQRSIRLSPENRTNLREALITYFNNEELRTLCVDLGIDYENLPGTTKESRARELIGLIERLNRIQDLVAICKVERPKVDWNQFVEENGSENNHRKPATSDVEPSEQEHISKQIDQSREGKMWKPQVWWVPIIVALTTLAGVIFQSIYSPTPKVTPDRFLYKLYVYSEDTGNPIPDADVTIDFDGPRLFEGDTDSNGYFQISMEPDQVNQHAQLIVKAAGYKGRSEYIVLVENDRASEIRLEPEPTETPTDAATPTLSPLPIATSTSTPTPALPTTSLVTEIPPLENRVSFHSSDPPPNTNVIPGGTVRIRVQYNLIAPGARAIVVVDRVYFENDSECTTNAIGIEPPQATNFEAQEHTGQSSGVTEWIPKTIPTNYSDQVKAVSFLIRLYDENNTSMFVREDNNYESRCFPLR